jgi:hypothetical protein
MRKLVAAVAAAVLVALLAPAAQAGPGSEICAAASRAYERVFDLHPPWECLQ